MIPNSTLPYLLIYPPLTDPTAPYHSISYLIGHAELHGFSGYSVLDANFEALEWCAKPSNVAHLLRLAQTVIADAEGTDWLSRESQIRYRIALSSLGMEADTVQQALDVFKRSDSFYNFSLYAEAADAVSRWQRMLNLFARPGTLLNFRLNPQGPVNLRRVDDLTNPNYLRALTEPFQGYFDNDFVKKVRVCRPILVGFSIAFRSQLPFALWLADIVRNELPTALICGGGTDVTDVSAKRSFDRLSRAKSEILHLL